MKLTASPRGLATIVILLLAATASGADWPAYRGDSGHSGYTDGPLAAPLAKLWSASHAAPAPAWEDPIREYHMLPFDYADQPIVAGGLVIFGSSADHQVHAIDLASGKEKWRFVTGGAIRFAPAVAEGKVFVAGDDGTVYCLSAADGKCVWSAYVGPARESVFANDQMASRWPLRSGLIVEGGVVYVNAGMWPLDGVYVCALKAADGSVAWKNKADGLFTPQGYMAAAAQVLIAPTGRTASWEIDRATGAGFESRGTAWAVVRDNQHFFGTGPYKADENLPVAGAWDMRPRPTGTLTAPVGYRHRRGTRNRGGRPIGNQTTVAVGGDVAYGIGGGRLTAYALPKWTSKWSVACGDAFEVAAAKNAVAVGGEKVVTVFAAADGAKLFQAPVEGQARGLAIGDGRLVVSTTTGQVACFGAGAPAPAANAATKPVEPSAAALKKADEILAGAKITEGYCLLVGGEADLAAALVNQSKLRVYVAEADAAKVAALRERFAAAGLYGRRVVVHPIVDRKLPHPEYFANLIVATAPSASPAELGRVLHPCGGQAWLSGGAKIEGEGVTESAEVAVRGMLPGAGEWTHLYANAGKSASSGDTRVRWPLKVLWFGNPGPGRMMNRHLRGTAPLFAGGRMFILGQHCIIAMDAYNGRELWSRPLPAIQRRVVDIRGGNMVTDGSSVYVVTGALCLRLDAASGELVQSYRLPVARPTMALDKEQAFDVGAAGNVKLRRTDSHLEIELTAKDAKPTNAVRATRPVMGDSWELFFDFRPADKRNGLYGPGAFHLIVVPVTEQSVQPAVVPGRAAACPAVAVTGQVNGAESTTTVVRIAWADVAKLAGGKSADFTFGAILNGSDNGTTRNARAYKFADNSSYRLANAWGTMVLDAKAAGGRAAEKTLDIADPLEQLGWGHLAIEGDSLVGSAVAQGDSPLTLQNGWDFSSEGHDYTGPQVMDVLGKIAVAATARQVFVLDRKSGALRWSHKPAATIPHNAIAVTGGRVYLMDRPDPWGGDIRRGEAPAAGALLALDLADGKTLWRKELPPTQDNQIRLANGVLVTASLATMTAWSAKDGTQMWTTGDPTKINHCSAWMRAPVLTGKWVYDEPRAYELATGRLRTNGQGQPWQWGGMRGCGTISGGENLLLFRGNYTTLVDTAETPVRYDMVGNRPGCFINMIVAGGIVLMPEASSGCGCAYYSFQTTVALSPGAAAGSK